MRTLIQTRTTTVTDDTKRQTLIFKCKTCDEAFEIIRAHKPKNFWAQIICLSDGLVELHLRPLEEKDY
jgi:hypothetical protein